MRTLPLRRGRPVAAITLMLIATSAMPDAQRRNRGDNGAAGLPLATNMIRLDPSLYDGQQVTVSAGVDEMVSKTAFVIDQRKVVNGSEVTPLGQPLLVIAPNLNAPVTHNSYLLVRGRVVMFDAAAIAKAAPGYTLDLPSGAGDSFKGQPVLVAASVLNATSVELARKPIPPPTAVEQSLSTAMKSIAPAFAALRTAAQQTKGDVVAQQATTLAPAFTQTEAIWDGMGQSAAAEWAREARRHAASIQTAAAAGNWDAVKTSYTALGQLCQNCHGIYRQQQEDGTYRLKPGSF